MINDRFIGMGTAMNSSCSYDYYAEGNRYEDEFAIEMEGEGDTTISFEGDIQITPFNMEEELEEGYFDKHGWYVYRKRDEDEIKDDWVDNIDMNMYKQAPLEEDNEEEMDVAPMSFDVTVCYKKILQIIKPGESILKALK